MIKVATYRNKKPRSDYAFEVKTMEGWSCNLQRWRKQWKEISSSINLEGYGRCYHQEQGIGLHQDANSLQQ